MRVSDRSLLFWVYGVLASMLVSWLVVLQLHRSCRGVDITLRPPTLSFVTEGHIAHMLQYFSAQRLAGAPFRGLSTHAMEQHIAKNDYIASCQIHKDWRGTLNVRVAQERPLARIFTDGGGDFYLMASGGMAPVSADYTERVVLVDYPSLALPRDKAFTDTPMGASLFHLVRILYQDDFWHEQIERISITAAGSVRLYPQLFRQEVLFGSLAGLQQRLSDQLFRLRLFYTKVLPAKGWDFYQAVDLRYNNQIIGKRR